MGITDSKSIWAKIQNDYKSIRKYCDPVYGQITVIQHKSSKGLFALIEKTFPKNNTHIPQFLSLPSRQLFFMKPQQHYECDLSLCSDIRLHFFLFEYSPRNLEIEIKQRSNDNNPFNRDEVIQLLRQQIDIMLALKVKNNPESNKPYRINISNACFLYSQQIELRTIQPVFRNQPQSVEELQNSHIPPQAFQMVINGQTFRAKETLKRQSSLVFILGVNFIELLLLADLSLIYQEDDFMDIQRLKEACRDIGGKYGADLQKIIYKMIQFEPSQRSSLLEVREQLMNLKKNRRSIVLCDRSKFNTEAS